MVEMTAITFPTIRRAAMRHFTIPGRFPGINEYVEECRRNKYGGNGMIRKSENVIMKHLKGTPLVWPIIIKYTFVEPNRRRDKDNVAGFFHKAFQDSLVKTKLLPDDSWAYIDSWVDSFDVDKNNPRIEIKIIEGDD